MKFYTTIVKESNLIIQENPIALWENPTPNSHYSFKPLAMVVKEETAPLHKYLDKSFLYYILNVLLMLIT